MPRNTQTQNSKTLADQKNVPRVLPPIVDRLVFVIPRLLLTDEEAWFGQALSSLKQAIERGECLPSFTGQQNYRYSVTFVGSSGARCLLQIGARRDTQRSTVRVDLNPAKFAKNELVELRLFLGRLFQDDVSRYLAAALINRIDLAVDVVGVDPDELLVAYSHSQHLTTVGKVTSKGGSRLETWRFGAFSSAFATIVYNKTAEQLVKLLDSLTGRRGGLSSTFGEATVARIKHLKSGATVTRFEVQCRKLNGLPLQGFAELENRFARFRIWPTAPLMAFDEPVKTLLLCACRERGVQNVIKLFNGHRLEERLQACFKNQVSWWDPDELWRAGVRSLLRNALFRTV